MWISPSRQCVRLVRPIQAATSPAAILILTLEQDVNYVHAMFLNRGQSLIRSVFEEAVALASLSLFLATVAVWAQVWAQVLGVL